MTFRPHTLPLPPRYLAGVLAVLLGIGLLSTLPARANDGDDEAAHTVELAAPDSETAEPALPDEIDWSILDSDPATMAGKPWFPARKASLRAGDAWSWKRTDNPDGTAAVTIKQPVSSFWDARIGADLSVVSQMPATSSEVLAEKIAHDNQFARSSGSAWAAMTAPGLGAIWDKTAIEARTDPTQDQSKLSASLSKSIPLDGDRSALTLQNATKISQQTLMPMVGPGASSRVVEVDQSARLGFTETGISLIAGQTHSTADDKWLRRIGAEQKVFGDVTITAALSETTSGGANGSLTAGFKRSW
jgi:hypothetical protein